VTSERLDDSTLQCSPANARVVLQTLIFRENWEGQCQCVRHQSELDTMSYIDVKISSECWSTDADVHGSVHA